MSIRRAVAVAILFLAFGFVTAPPAVARDTGCPDKPVTLRDLMALYRDQGPLATRFPPAVAWINERGRACFGATTLRFRAFVDGAGGIGGASAYTVQPRWFLGSALIVFATDREVEPGVGDGPFYGIAVPPRFGDVQGRYHRQWVTVAAHFADSRAGSCRADGAPGETPNRRQAIRICQSMLVLSSIGPARGAVTPDTAIGSTRRALASGSQRDATNVPWAALVAAAAVGAWLTWRRPTRPVTPHSASPGREARR